MERKFLSKRKYIAINIIPSAIVFTFVFFTLSFRPGLVGFIGIAIFPALATLLFGIATFLAVKKSIKKNPRNRIFALKVFAFLVIAFYAGIESVMAMIVIHTYISLLLLIPATFAIFSVPALSLTGFGKKDFSSHGELNQELTERLSSLIGKQGPEVYTSESDYRFGLASISGKDPWRILVNQSAMVQLTDAEMDTLLLEKYFSKESEGARKLLTGIYGYFTLVVYILMISYVLSMNSSPGTLLNLAMLALLFLAVVLVFLSPKIILQMVLKYNISTDILVIKKTEDYDSLKSLLDIEAKIPPATMMTESRYYRYMDRRAKNNTLRLNRLERQIRN